MQADTRPKVRQLPITKKPAVRDTALFLWVAVLILLCLVCGCRRQAPVEPTAGMDVPEELWIRVLLFDNIRQVRLGCESGLTVVDNLSSTKAYFSGPCRGLVAKIDKGKIIVGATGFSADITMLPDRPFIVDVDGQLYRGNIRLRAVNEENLEIINHLPIESYLAGVVPAEMPSYWEPEALKAQAVACRTYCLFIRKRSGTNRRWDMRKTQAHQVYRGLSAETVTAWQAVNDTAGQVLTCKQPEKPDGIFPAYYSSSCGGHTENSRPVFGDSYLPLRAVSCPYCSQVAKNDFFNWSEVAFDIKDISNSLIKRYPSLAELEEIVDIEVHRQADHGSIKRIVSVKLTGRNGRYDLLGGEDFRLTVDPTGNRIKSFCCDMSTEGSTIRFHNGVGFGHGVGMCQCGAEGMARQGYDYRQILRYYYPGSEISTMYRINR